VLNKVIWGTDGSDCADAALPFAKRIVERSNGELVVVYAVEVIGPHEEGSGQPMLRTEPETRRTIEAQVAELSGEGITVTFEAPTCKIGAVAQELAQVADAKRAHMIVIGTRGATVLSGMFAGSVALRLLHLAHVPVMAVPPAGASQE
jgi:nucleotide-binding universal stress UspA family protein